MKKYAFLKITFFSFTVSILVMWIYMKLLGEIVVKHLGNFTYSSTSIALFILTFVIVYVLLQLRKERREANDLS
jgi:hypothetical protein